MKECPVPEAEFDCPHCKCGFCELKRPEEECDDYYYYMEGNE